MFCVNFLIFKRVNFSRVDKNQYLIDNNNYLYFNNKKTIIYKKNILNKKYLNFMFKINNNNYFYFNNLNNFFLKNFISTLQKFIENGLKFVVVSFDNSLVLPYYLSIFKEEDIFNNKNFLFYDSQLINYKNWLYFFNKFIKKFSITSILFLDYKNLYKFFTIYNKIELIKFSVLSDSVLNVFFDYYFFSNKSELVFYNTVLLNYFVSLFFLNFNNKKLNLKIHYKKFFFRTINKNKFLFF